MPRDPIELEIFKSIYHSIAEEMGAALRRTAFSSNIKERCDYSCAVFDADGEVIAMGDHIHVTLGIIAMSCVAANESFEPRPGDVVMLNDPFRGGTHLPDITLVAPVYVGQKKRGQDSFATAGEDTGATKRGRRRRRRTGPDFFVASRAHHADVGGTYPGPMGLGGGFYQGGWGFPR